MLLVRIRKEEGGLLTLIPTPRTRHVSSRLASKQYRLRSNFVDATDPTLLKKTQQKRLYKTSQNTEQSAGPQNLLRLREVTAQGRAKETDG